MLDMPIGEIKLNNKQDLEIVREIFTENVYGIDTRISLAGTVLDVGAHVGLFSRLALDRGCRVFSVEPEMNNFERLQENAPGATHINKAVTNNKEAFLSVHPTRGELHKLSGTGVPVRTITLDALIEKCGIVDVLKMDIEGGEYNAFYHCHNLHLVNQITMEYHLGIPLAVELIRFLGENGFQPIYISGEDFGQLQLIKK